ncbi:SDR family oxidoreductase [candidate division KSB1 bacterium]
MSNQEIMKWTDLSGKTAVITGGSGVLGGEIVSFLANSGANIAVIDINDTAGEQIVNKINSELGSDQAIFIKCNVLDKTDIVKSAGKVMGVFGGVDFLINGAGGNKPEATTGQDKSFFDIPEEALRFVTDLNLTSTILSSQVYGKIFAEKKQGIILNISSVNAFRPLTRIPAYSAAKAAVSNFTQWLAVHMAKEYSPEIRVNAIAPGFFLTEQNKFLLIDNDTGELTERGKTIIEHTPVGRFGAPDDLFGTVLWLLSPASSFVTGIVVPVDGGFSAFSGV